MSQERLCNLMVGHAYCKARQKNWVLQDFFFFNSCKWNLALIFLDSFKFLLFSEGKVENKKKCSSTYYEFGFILPMPEGERKEGISQLLSNPADCEYEVIHTIYYFQYLFHLYFKELCGYLSVWSCYLVTRNACTCRAVGSYIEFKQLWYAGAVL